MQTMKYIKVIFIPLVLAICLFQGDTLNALNTKTIYYFYAENCESCRKAQAHYKKPDGIKDGTSWQHGDITIIPYRIVDSNNKLVRANIGLLINMCEKIQKKTGKNEFVYYDRDLYEYYSKDGLPYYRKENRYARRDDPFPTPVFIIGDRVVLGFNLNLINNSLAVFK